jgi:acetylornithine deacetylase
VIGGMAPVLAGLRAVQARLERRPHPLLGPASVHASLIAGGQELSSYPERCVLSVERRKLDSVARCADVLTATARRFCA